MHKLSIQCSCCCHDPAPQFTFERDESVRFGSTLPRPSSVLGLLWYSSCIGDTGLLSQVATAPVLVKSHLHSFCSVQLQTGACLGCSLHFQTFPAISWFEVLGIEIIIVHIESSSCSPDNLALSPSVGRRVTLCLPQRKDDGDEKNSFLFKCKEFDWGSLFPSFQHESLKIVVI